MTWSDEEGLAKTKKQLAALQASKKRGKAAEKKVAADLKTRHKDVRTQVAVRTCNKKADTDGVVRTRRTMDILVTLDADEPGIGKKGQTVAVEVKSGGAVRTKAQERNDALIAKGKGCKFIGKNSPPTMRDKPIPAKGIKTVIKQVP
jgi:hypothetical protein